MKCKDLLGGRVLAGQVDESASRKVKGRIHAGDSCSGTTRLTENINNAKNIYSTFTTRLGTS